jgi:hypothetical protein
VPDSPGPDQAPDAVRRRALLREEVGRFRARETRRVFDTTVHVGELGGPRTGYVVRAADLPAFDDGLRADVVGTLLEDSPERWTTLLLHRAGTPEQHDLDLRWLAAATTAFGSHDRPLRACYVVCRSGWRDVRTGESRTWTRLRL